MDEDDDEEKLNALQKKIKFEDEFNLPDYLKAFWHMNRIIARKQRTLNALKWIHFQHTLELYLKSWYIVHIIGMPTERDKEKARKAKRAKDD